MSSFLDIIGIGGDKDTLVENIVNVTTEIINRTVISFQTNCSTELKVKQEVSIKGCTADNDLYKILDEGKACERYGETNPCYCSPCCIYGVDQDTSTTVNISCVLDNTASSELVADMQLAIVNEASESDDVFSEIVNLFNSGGSDTVINQTDIITVISNTIDESFITNLSTKLEESQKVSIEDGSGTISFVTQFQLNEIVASSIIKNETFNDLMADIGIDVEQTAAKETLGPFSVLIALFEAIGEFLTSFGLIGAIIIGAIIMVFGGTIYKTTDLLKSKYFLIFLSAVIVLIVVMGIVKSNEKEEEEEEEEE